MSLAIGTINPGVVDAQFVASLVATLTDDWTSDKRLAGRFLMAHAPSGMLHVARNQIVAAFLAHQDQPEWLLFIDSDMTWQAESVWRLVEAATVQGLPVLGALTSVPGQDHQPIPLLYDADMRLMPMPSTRGLLRVGCVGTAFLCIARTVLSTMRQHYGEPTPWFDYHHWNGRAPSEDVIFSQRLTDLHIPMHVDTRVTVGHRRTITCTYPHPHVEESETKERRNYVQS